MPRQKFGGGLLLPPVGPYCDTIIATGTVTTLVSNTETKWRTHSASRTLVNPLTLTHSFTFTGSRSGSISYTTVCTFSQYLTNQVQSESTTTVATATGTTTVTLVNASGTMTFDPPSTPNTVSTTGYTTSFTNTITRNPTNTFTSLITISNTVEERVPGVDLPLTVITTYSFTTEIVTTSYTMFAGIWGRRRVSEISLA